MYSLRLWVGVMRCSVAVWAPGLAVGAQGKSGVHFSCVIPESIERKCARSDGNFKFRKVATVNSCSMQDRLNETLAYHHSNFNGEWMNVQLECDVTDAAKCAVSGQSS